MPPKQLAPKLLSWASEIDEQTVAQAQRTARLPIIEGHVALDARRASRYRRDRRLRHPDA